MSPRRSGSRLRGDAPRGPRRLGDAVRSSRAEVAPATLLAAVQAVWGEVGGARVAAESEPVAERDGVVTVACRSATWAQELDLLQDELLGRLNAALGAREWRAKARERGGGSPPEAAGYGLQVKRLRFTADAARHDR
jgi:predicted nucleic acid-binding Zn ribbon protein